MQAGYLLTLALPDQDRFFDDKADILEVNGFGESCQFTLRPGEAPSRDLLAFLRLINLSGAALASLMIPSTSNSEMTDPGRNK